MKKWFYERSRFSEFKSNTTYHDLLGKTDKEFTEARLLRKEVTSQWDEYGTPPVIGKDESGIVDFSKLKDNPCDFLQEDKMVIKNHLVSFRTLTKMLVLLISSFQQC